VRRFAVAVLVSLAVLVGTPAGAATTDGWTPDGTAAARTRPPGLPSDLPLDHAGVPTRPLADEELFRLLVALSATNEAAAALLVRCHAAGTPFGNPGWRECVMAR
jgi:hypothetical protein